MNQLYVNLLPRRYCPHPVISEVNALHDEVRALTLALSQARAQLQQERIISHRLLRATLERVVEHSKQCGEDPDVAFVEAASGCTVPELQSANRLGNQGFLIDGWAGRGLQAAYEDPFATFIVGPEWDEWDPERRQPKYGGWAGFWRV